ncbi:SURF1 family cytochrome oxidase biogenesis protein [Nocardiopsis salina]|uniref:SURF1 family cytochrome oxidase biogenesis protein n=1 Tax=Nocardiopsis salina TaxID=245836 RepID=UPI00037A7E93|nr:SURF1 family protein [Nocardiopsis salina]
MLKVLFSSRMLAFHALVVLAVPSFIWLGFWQLDRWEARSAQMNLQQDNVAAEAVPVEDLTSVGTDVAPDDRWRTVEATGTWDTDNEVLLRNRDGSQGVGFHVLTPLVTEEGPALLVNRGWIERGEDAHDTPEPPAVPDGEVTVEGRLHYSENEDNTGLSNRDDLPEGQIMIVDVDELAERLPHDVYGGYAELTDQAPVPENPPERVPLHEEDSGMSASYAVQWWVFAVVAVVGWIVLMRREIRDAREREAAVGDGGDPGSGPTGGTGGPDDGPSGSGADTPRTQATVE